jgi:glycosyltransferase involved in cell wall biosynthesis
MGRCAGVEVVLLTDHEIRTWMRPHHGLVDRLSLALSAGMIVPSNAVKAFDGRKLGLPQDKIWVIPNGVDVDSFRVTEPMEIIRRDLRLDPRARWVGFVGRLDDAVKGISHLLEAMTRVKGTERAQNLAIVGEGPYDRWLREKTKAMGLDGRVAFLGVRRDIPRILRAMDLLVLPSVVEGSGLVILEAMAAGTPVLATAVGGIPELVTHGETGYLVPASDATRLAEGIQFMLQNAERAREMARKAQGWVHENRSIHKTASAMASLYDKLLEAGEAQTR